MKMTGEDSSRALAERMLAIDAVTQSTNALLQQLLWLLLAKGFFAKSELVAAIDTCIVASRRASARAVKRPPFISHTSGRQSKMAILPSPPIDGTRCVSSYGRARPRRAASPASGVREWWGAVRH
jgi:hypothetical protein